MALKFDVEVGQDVTVSGGCTIRVERKAGRKVRLLIDTKSDVSVGEAPEAKPTSVPPKIESVLTRRSIPV